MEQNFYPKLKVNNRSLLDASRIIGDDSGVIGIYGSPDTRTILIEQGKADRIIEKYHIKFDNSFCKEFYSDAPLHWRHTTLSLSQSTLDKIKNTQESATTTHVYTLNSAEMITFKQIIHAYTGKNHVLNGDQDETINKALTQIGHQEIAFKSSSCTIL